MIYLHKFFPFTDVTPFTLSVDPLLRICMRVKEKQMNAKNETEKVCHAKNQALKSLARTNTEWKTFFPFLV